MEEGLARLATRMILSAGGRVSFDDYDRIMKYERYVPPMHWMNGWGLTASEKRANDNKMCVFKACDLGLVSQSDDHYSVTDKGKALTID